jgi:hypothetical protein
MRGQAHYVTLVACPGKLILLADGRDFISPGEGVGVFHVYSDLAA